MSANQPNPDTRQPEKPKIKDVPGCIKYIILLFLLFLLFWEFYAGEYRGFPKVSQTVLIIILLKILLIILLLILIWVQRRLNCNVTAPSGCTTAEYDAVNDRWFIKITGTASGTVFGNYTLAVERPPGTPYPATIIYPGGGASGTAMVVNGELGRINVTYVEPAPMRVKLTVNPAGSGSPCVHYGPVFDWANRAVYIEKIATIPARNMGLYPTPPAEVLKIVRSSSNPANPDASIAGSVSVEGGADYTGCGREMVEYALQYRQVNFGSHPWHQDAAAPGDWTTFDEMPLSYGDPGHPRTFLWIFGTWFNAITHGKITRKWAIGDFLMSIVPWVEVPRPYTAERAWNTATVPGGNGRFTVRLVVKQQPIGGPPPPTELYDAATVWIDNRQIEGFIHHLGIDGDGALNVCDELLLSQFITPTPLGSPPPAGPFSKVNATINGRAWDPIILDSYTHTDHPNDNFNNYTLEFFKDGSGGPVPIGSSTNRVPATLQQAPLPAPPAAIGVLNSWDIVTALDAGPPAAAPAPYPKIYRGERCAYLIHLVVTDTTPQGDGGSVHTKEHYFPFCIMNDITENVPFPVL